MATAEAPTGATGSAQTATVEGAGDVAPIRAALPDCPTPPAAGPVLLLAARISDNYPDPIATPTAAVASSLEAPKPIDSLNASIQDAREKWFELDNLTGGTRLKIARLLNGAQDSLQKHGLLPLTLENFPEIEAAILESEDALQQLKQRVLEAKTAVARRDIIYASITETQTTAQVQSDPLNSSDASDTRATIVHTKGTNGSKEPKERQIMKPPSESAIWRDKVIEALQKAVNNKNITSEDVRVGRTEHWTIVASEQMIHIGDKNWIFIAYAAPETGEVTLSITDNSGNVIDQPSIAETSTDEKSMITPHRAVAVCVANPGSYKITVKMKGADSGWKSIYGSCDVSINAQTSKSQLPQTAVLMSANGAQPHL